MDKLLKKKMIEHLASFRAASDRVNDDLSDLSQKILLILDEVSKFENINEREEKVRNSLSALVEPIMNGIIHSHEYNNSMWNDYTQVVKTLGASNDVKNNGD